MLWAQFNTFRFQVVFFTGSQRKKISGNNMVDHNFCFRLHSFRVYRTHVTLFFNFSRFAQSNTFLLISFAVIFLLRPLTIDWFAGKIHKIEWRQKRHTFYSDQSNQREDDSAWRNIEDRNISVLFSMKSWYPKSKKVNWRHQFDIVCADHSFISVKVRSDRCENIPLKRSPVYPHFCSKFLVNLLIH